MVARGAIKGEWHNSLPFRLTYTFQHKVHNKLPAVIIEVINLHSILVDDPPQVDFIKRESR